MISGVDFLHKNGIIHYDIEAKYLPYLIKKFTKANFLYTQSKNFAKSVKILKTVFFTKNFKHFKTQR